MAAEPATSTCTRFVAFIDILGFSQSVESSPPSTIVRLFERVFISLLRSYSRDLQSRILKLAATPNAHEVAKPLFAKLERAAALLKADQTPRKDALDDALRSVFPFHYMIVSDSIVFYSDAVSESLDATDIFKEFVIFVRHFMADAFLNRLLLRGAISFGEFYVDTANSIYFGRALLDAIRLEKKQQWIGCVLSDTMDSLVADYFSGAKLAVPRDVLPTLPYIHPIAGHTINKYQVPMRDGATFDSYIVNWYPRLIGHIQINNHFFKGELTGDPSVDIKYENTLAYMKWWNSKLEEFMGRGPGRMKGLLPGKP